MIKTKHGKIYYIFYKILALSILKFVLKVLFRVEVSGCNNIPKNGRVILCSNHISYIDPVVIGAFFPRYVYFMGKMELFKNKFLTSFFTFFNSFSVNRFAVDRKAINTAIKVLKDDQILGMFPEGTRSEEGIIKKGKKGMGLISIIGKSPILPVAIAGTNKIIQKPHKRIFFPKIRMMFGDLIDTSDILKKHGKKEAVDIIVEKTMDSIKNLYEKIK